MSEEDIEILEKLIEKYDEPCGMHINPIELWQDERDAIENLINRVKELEEENSKMKADNLLKLNKEINKNITEGIIIKDYISKSKIKEKIEDREHIIHNAKLKYGKDFEISVDIICAREEIYVDTICAREEIRLLKELLEEDE